MFKLKFVNRICKNVTSLTSPKLNFKAKVYFQAYFWGITKYDLKLILFSKLTFRIIILLEIQTHPTTVIDIFSTTKQYKDAIYVKCKFTLYKIRKWKVLTFLSQYLSNLVEGEGEKAELEKWGGRWEKNLWDVKCEMKWVSVSFQNAQCFTK